MQYINKINQIKIHIKNQLIWKILNLFSNLIKKIVLKNRINKITKNNVSRKKATKITNQNLKFKKLNLNNKLNLM